MENLELEKLKIQFKLHPRVLLFFYTTWCGQCKMMEKLLSKIKNDFSNVKILTLDIDEQKLWTDDNNDLFSIHNAPTFIYVKNGEIVDRIELFQNEQDFRDFLKKNE